MNNQTAGMAAFAALALAAQSAAQSPNAVTEGVHERIEIHAPSLDGNHVNRTAERPGAHVMPFFSEHLEPGN